MREPRLLIDNAHLRVYSTSDDFGWNVGGMGVITVVVIVVE